MEDDEEEEEPVLKNRYVQTNFIEGTNSLQDSDDVDEEGDEDEENEDEDEIEKEREEDRRQTRTAALYLYLAFLLCSAAFEPDFGSWIRHQGVALPIILLIL